MAEKDNLDLAEAAGTAKSKGSPLKLVILILVTALLTGGVVAGVLYFVLGGDGSEVNQVAVETRKPLTYVTLEPELLGNIDGPGRIRFVQVGVVLALRDPKVMEAVDRYNPVIRNDLIMLLSDKTYEELNSAQGKEATRQQMLETIRSVLERNTGVPGVESLYFTSFVMQ